MPFKSEAQRRKFAELVKQGKMQQKTFDEFNQETPKHIPERIKPLNNLGPRSIPKPRSIEEIRNLFKKKLSR